MKGVEEGACDQVRGPDHGGWLDEETASDTTHGEADKLGRHNDHPLIAEIVDLLVVDALHSDNISCIGRA